MKPGYKTTEMWITVVSQMVAAIVVLVNTMYGTKLEVSIFTQVVATGGAFAYAAMTAIWYVRSRATIKAQTAIMQPREVIRTEVD